MVGTSVFLSDLLIEYIRFTYFKNASDFIREKILVSRDKGEMNDIKGLDMDEDEVLKLSGMENFMQPIEKNLRLDELKREKFLDSMRQSKIETNR